MKLIQSLSPAANIGGISAESGALVSAGRSIGLTQTCRCGPNTQELTGTREDMLTYE